MKRMSVLVAAGFIAALGISPAWAEENHKAEATKQALAAAESGKKGDAAAVREHAKKALEHAEAAQNEKPNPHLEAGIKNLRSTIEQCDKGQTAAAGEAADAAATHLEAAERSF